MNKALEIKKFSRALFFNQFSNPLVSILPNSKDEIS